MSDFRKIKTITSHRGHAQFLAECDWEETDDIKVVGYIARVQREHIPSPYAYSPSNQLFCWNGKKVLVSEVSHKRYEVYEVSPQLLTFKTDEAATDWHIRFSRRAVA